MVMAAAYTGGCIMLITSTMLVLCDLWGQRSNEHNIIMCVYIKFDIGITLNLHE